MACSSGDDEGDAGPASSVDDGSADDSGDGTDAGGSDDGGDESGGGDDDAGTGQAEDDADDDVSPDSSGDPLIEGSDLAERLGDLPGQLAIGSGTAVAVARPDGQALQVLGFEGEVAAQPTWSNDGTALAWSSISSQRQSVLVQEFDDEGLPDGEPRLSTAEGFPVFYLQWSDDDEQLVFLRRAAGPGLVEFGFVVPGEAAEPAAQDSPFFVAWSPTSDRVLAHVGQRAVELHDPAAPDEPAVVLDRGDDYSAPAWIDADRALVVVDGDLAIVTVDDGTVDPVEPAAGPIRFVLSPDRRRVAYRLLNLEDPGPLTASFTGPGPARGATPAGLAEQAGLVVLDLETGEREMVADDSAVAWEWSPDGSRLAWLSIPDGGPLVGTWNFWAADGTDLAVEQGPRFNLSRKYAQAYLPFFAQYSHSVTGWAPDSSAFAFAGNVDGDRGVWIQLIDGDAPAQRISTGDIVTWGTGPAPDPTGGASAA